MEAVSHFAATIFAVTQTQGIGACLVERVAEEAGVTFHQNMVAVIQQRKHGVQLGSRDTCHDLDAYLLIGLGFKAVIIHVPGLVNVSRNRCGQCDHLTP